MKRHWYDYFWVWAIVYFSLGFFNIVFAWLGLFDVLAPLIFAIAGGNKFFCNRMCGRGQLFLKLGREHKWSRKQPTPAWLCSRWFRLGFLVFFLAVFANMLFQTWLVWRNADTLRQALTLFWTFSLPWAHATPDVALPHWVVQFSYGFYSIMLTSFLLGLILMALYKPRSWCAFCPMGTMTQAICKWRNHWRAPAQ